MDMDIDSGFVGRLGVVATGRRRRWSDAEKLRIVAESLAGSRQALRLRLQ
jgi:transposase